MTRTDARPGGLERIRTAVVYCARPQHLRPTLVIALVVGSWLTLANQGDVLFGVADARGLGLSNLGLLSGRTEDAAK